MFYQSMYLVTVSLDSTCTGHPPRLNYRLQLHSLFPFHVCPNKAPANLLSGRQKTLHFTLANLELREKFLPSPPEEEATKAMPTADADNTQYLATSIAPSLSPGKRGLFQHWHAPIQSPFCWSLVDEGDRSESPH